MQKIHVISIGWFVVWIGWSLNRSFSILGIVIDILWRVWKKRDTNLHLTSLWFNFKLIILLTNWLFFSRYHCFPFIFILFPHIIILYVALPFNFNICSPSLSLLLIKKNYFLQETSYFVLNINLISVFGRFRKNEKKSQIIVTEVVTLITMDDRKIQIPNDSEIII